MSTRILAPDDLANWCDERRARGQKIVTTNGCFDVLHAGHVEILQKARSLGDCLLVFINSDASVRRLKGETRPINDENARAFVLSALGCVDGVCVFGNDTPIRVLEIARPEIHVKGGDYVAENLPETATIRAHGGEIVIVPLRDGFSTTRILQKLAHNTSAKTEISVEYASEVATSKKNSVEDISRSSAKLNGENAAQDEILEDESGNSNRENGEANVEIHLESAQKTRCLIVIPARYGSTRFPGKPLANLGGKTVIEHVVERALQTSADRPILVATDDQRIARTVAQCFDVENVRIAMTNPDCETGTDRIAQAIIEYSNAAISPDERLIVVNVQGDEPFVSAAHLDELIATMRAEPTLKMATLATQISDEAQISDHNVVKVVRDLRGDALYFSRFSLPFERDANVESSTRSSKLRHVGVYAYDAKWLLEMAQLPPSPLEKSEKLEQLRALENGVEIRVLVVENVVNIAIDTPQDLVAAQRYLKEMK